MEENWVGGKVEQGWGQPEGQALLPGHLQVRGVPYRDSHVRQSSNYLWYY